MPMPRNNAVGIIILEAVASDMSAID